MTTNRKYFDVLALLKVTVEEESKSNITITICIVINNDPVSVKIKLAPPTSCHKLYFYLFARNRKLSLRVSDVTCCIVFDVAAS